MISKGHLIKTNPPTPIAAPVTGIVNKVPAPSAAPAAPPTATAPGLAPSGIDVCSVSASAGLQTFGLGVSGGKSFRDKNCERIKLSRELRANGMNVAAVALLCQDPRVFQSMEMAGTPCPIDGKIGKQAQAQWKKYGKLRPDYDLYVKRLKVIEDAENNSKNSSQSDPDE